VGEEMNPACISGEALIMLEIMTFGPIQSAFSIDDSFMK
jgi:hypothetical protein